MVHSTSHTLPDATPISIAFGNKNVTKVGGLPFVMGFMHKRKILESLLKIVTPAFPRPLLPYRYSHQDILDQMMAGYFTGQFHFSDAVDVKCDPLYVQSLSARQVACPATLHRYIDRIAKELSDAQQGALKAAGIAEPAKTDILYISTPLMTKLNFSLLETALKFLKKRTPGPIIIDVDGTPLPVHGKQEMSAYDGHYQCNCYLPIFITINGLPAFMQNAPGAANGASLFFKHVDEILKLVKRAFPHKKIIVRGDTGYNSDALISKIVANGCRYIIGANAAGGKGQTRVLKEQVIKDLQDKEASENIPAAVLQFFLSDKFELTPPPGDVPCPNAQTPLSSDQTAPDKQASLSSDKTSSEEQTATPENAPDPKQVAKFRCCGLLREYQPKSWTTERTYLCYRLQFNKDFNKADGGVDLRYVQTNLTRRELLAVTRGRGQRKGRSDVEASFENKASDARLAIEFYEALFCDRAQDERLNCEWKSQCYACCCSCSNFFANSLRMLLSGFAMLVLTLLRNHIWPVAEETPASHRNSKKPNVSRAHLAEKLHCGPTLQSIRDHFINVPATIKKTKYRLVIHLQAMTSFWRTTFVRYANTP